MKHYHHTATVQGVGPFPIDMLRYDSAWPATEGDAGHIAQSIAGPGKPYAVMVEQINNTTKKPDVAWTIDRWRSFGARVTATTVI